MVLSKESSVICGLGVEKGWFGGREVGVSSALMVITQFIDACYV